MIEIRETNLSIDEIKEIRDHQSNENRKESH